MHGLTLQNSVNQFLKLFRSFINIFNRDIGSTNIINAYLLCGGYHLERGGMPLHDAVGINCKRGPTTENQGSGVKYMG